MKKRKSIKEQLYRKKRSKKKIKKTRNKRKKNKRTKQNRKKKNIQKQQGGARFEGLKNLKDPDVPLFKSSTRILGQRPLRVQATDSPIEVSRSVLDTIYNDMRLPSIIYDLFCILYFIDQDFRETQERAVKAEEMEEHLGYVLCKPLLEKIKGSLELGKKLNGEDLLNAAWKHLNPENPNWKEKLENEDIHTFQNVAAICQICRDRNIEISVDSLNIEGIYEIARLHGVSEEIIVWRPFRNANFPRESLMPISEAIIKKAVHTPPLYLSSDTSYQIRKILEFEPVETSASLRSSPPTPFGSFDLSHNCRLVNRRFGKNITEIKDLIEEHLKEIPGFWSWKAGDPFIPQECASVHRDVVTEQWGEPAAEETAAEESPKTFRMVHTEAIERLRPLMKTTGNIYELTFFWYKIRESGFMELIEYIDLPDRAKGVTLDDIERIARYFGVDEELITRARNVEEMGTRRHHNFNSIESLNLLIMDKINPSVKFKYLLEKLESVISGRFHSQKCTLSRETINKLRHCIRLLKEMNIIDLELKHTCGHTRKVILYRAGQSSGKKAESEQKYNTIHGSLSYGTSIFAGVIHSQGGSVCDYLEDRNPILSAVIFNPNDYESIFYIPPLTPCAAILARGFLFHSRTKIPAEMVEAREVIQGFGSKDRSSEYTLKYFNPDDPQKEMLQIKINNLNREKKQLLRDKAKASGKAYRKEMEEARRNFASSAAAEAEAERGEVARLEEKIKELELRGEEQKLVDASVFVLADHRTRGVRCLTTPLSKADMVEEFRILNRDWDYVHNQNWTLRIRELERSVKDRNEHREQERLKKEQQKRDQIYKDKLLADYNEYELLPGEPEENKKEFLFELIRSNPANHIHDELIMLFLQAFIQSDSNYKLFIPIIESLALRNGYSKKDKADTLKDLENKDTRGRLCFEMIALNDSEEDIQTLIDQIATRTGVEIEKVAILIENLRKLYK